jgi:hypothetical protein
MIPTITEVAALLEGAPGRTLPQACEAAEQRGLARTARRHEGARAVAGHPLRVVGGDALSEPHRWLLVRYFDPAPAVG